jgi:hypothetical protein
MSRKLSLSTAALSAALLALSLLPKPPHATSDKEPKQSYRTTQGQPRISPMDETVFYPFVGDASILQNRVAAASAPK